MDSAEDGHAVLLGGLRFVPLYARGGRPRAQQGRPAAPRLPPTCRITRWLGMLHAHDARAAAATHREIAAVLFGRASFEEDDRDRRSAPLASSAPRCALPARWRADGLSPPAQPAPEGPAEL